MRSGVPRPPSGDRNVARRSRGGARQRCRPGRRRRRRPSRSAARSAGSRWIRCVGRCARAQTRPRPGGRFGGITQADALGRGFRVCEDTGASLASVLTRLAAMAADERRRRDEVSVALAGPRSSGVLLALLPALGVLAGAGLGASPLHFLVPDARRASLSRPWGRIGRAWVPAGSHDSRPLRLDRLGCHESGRRSLFHSFALPLAFGAGPPDRAD